ncbi:MAG TPA: carboxylesterase family protein, partial [Pseudomonadales bacterium]|nr:carboxylesterase family protein [Pseudomonadales bacterium]
MLLPVRVLKSLVIFSVLAATTFISSCKPLPTVFVNTPLGVIGGNDGGHYHAFLGIPYAKPPVADLRWRMPEPYPAFSSPYAATAFGAGCKQFTSLTDVLVTSENCLFLNIWRPSEREKNTAQEKLPVMVYIHGGAFTLGSSSESSYDGSALAVKHKVIVVSLNYRLGYLGFLSLPELTAEAGHSGNYA